MSIPKKPKGYHRPKSYARTALIISLLSTIACSPSQKTMENWISSGHDIKYLQHLKKQIDKSNSTLKIDKDIIPTLRSGLASGNNNVIHEIENIILENHNIRPLKETAAYELRNSNVSPSQFQRLFQYRLSQPLESMQTKMIGIYLSRVESPLLYKELINSIKTHIPNNDYERCTKAVHSFSSISELHQKTAFNLSQSIDECKKAYEDSERKKEAWTSASMTTEALKLESKNLDTNYKNALESNKKTPVILFYATSITTEATYDLYTGCGIQSGLGDDEQQLLDGIMQRTLPRCDLLVSQPEDRKRLKNLFDGGIKIFNIAARRDGPLYPQYDHSIHYLCYGSSFEAIEKIYTIRNYASKKTELVKKIRDQNSNIKQLLSDKITAKTRYDNCLKTLEELLASTR